MPYTTASIVPYRRLRLSTFQGPGDLTPGHREREIEIAEYGDRAQAAILLAIAALPEE